MIASLKKINRRGSDTVHQPVLLRDTARPTTREDISKRLRFAYALEWIAHHCLNQVQDSESGAPVGFYPKPQIFQEFRLKDRVSLSFPFHQECAGAGRLQLWAFVFHLPRAAMP
jgi:hypothetical protein